MSDRDYELPDEDDAFVARIAAPLRAPERVGATFKERVMTSVRAAARNARPAPVEPPAAREAWWRRPWTIRLTPIAGLAMAAGIALVAALGVAARGRAPITHVAAAQPDTVYVMRFVFVAPSARSVALVGDFNNWDRTSTTLSPVGEGGLWTASVTLPPGRHEYAFIVDGTRWTADPFAPITIHDDFGTTSSVVTVGTRAG